MYMHNTPYSIQTATQTHMRPINIDRCGLWPPAIQTTANRCANVRSRLHTRARVQFDWVSRTDQTTRGGGHRKLSDLFDDVDDVPHFGRLLHFGAIVPCQRDRERETHWRGRLCAAMHRVVRLRGFALHAIRFKAMLVFRLERARVCLT